MAVPTHLYGGETWVQKNENIGKIEAIKMRF
jgi:hypothetical protein